MFSQRARDTIRREVDRYCSIWHPFCTGKNPIVRTGHPFGNGSLCSGWLPGSFGSSTSIFQRLVLDAPNHTQFFLLRSRQVCLRCQPELKLPSSRMGGVPAEQASGTKRQHPLDIYIQCMHGYAQYVQDSPHWVWVKLQRAAWYFLSLYSSRVAFQKGSKWQDSHSDVLLASALHQRRGMCQNRDPLYGSSVETHRCLMPGALVSVTWKRTWLTSQSREISRIKKRNSGLLLFPSTNHWIDMLAR